MSTTSTSAEQPQPLPERTDLWLSALCQLIVAWTDHYNVCHDPKCHSLKLLNDEQLSFVLRSSNTARRLANRGGASV